MEQQSAVSLDVLALRFGADDPAVTFGVAPRQWEPFAGELALPGVLLGRGERLVTAARRAVHSKLGVPEDAILAVGQLVTFDEPHRDPRGPTLSIAMWAVLGGPATPTGARWVSFDAVPPLAFDHNMIVEVARERLAEMLWKDLTFTRPLIGEHFPATRAVALATALAGTRPDPGNLNRTLAAIPGLTRTGERMRTKATGRPAAVWSFNDSATSEH
ncbi:MULTISPECIES: NUDIX hydrolase [Nocardia]|uniref:NUDIX domain-containing protein n=1 Tax=Nocardia TaxID=1817 RepID=UPI0007E9A44A|nr:MULTISPECIES: NUDIX hydrolase [Nocardia]OBF64264.1 DNA hydrolase [Mycobacterium sp. 852002-51759_SCH5129042]MBF6277707.1 NUDIX hydrolase [Nocardia nova]OBA45862.1 DNA hydrolase [Nocardia sp. 852002-51101_SCH5132738]OBB44387.1 DNA hydrolase [Nocardia sp. 852002-51244_SCH5132740]PPJ06306.1 NUDIX hydrolase [Nocardia nova]